MSVVVDALADNDHANMEAAIECLSRCACRPSSCELGGHDRVILKLHLEAKIE